MAGDKPLRAFAVAAHADDIEFGMSGTLLRLADLGCEIHCMNVADGSCGSASLGPKEIAAMRWEEARRAASHVGAKLHPPLCPDLEIFYTDDLVRRMAAVMREVAPDVLLVPAPHDYMEDHVNAGRLAVTGAFVRGIRNYVSDPPLPPTTQDVVIYHAQPHGNRDPLNRFVRPDLLVDISGVIERKAAMLSEHRSQKEWLDYSQGLDAYLQTMRDFGAELAAQPGALTGCAYAEGWRRHNPLGFCSPSADPLGELLG